MKKIRKVGTSNARPHYAEGAKGNNGITLIALVITIIIMLIIVAVSIQVAMDSGLFNIAGKAAKEYKTEQEKESDLKIQIGDKTYNSIEDYLNQNPNSTLGVNLKLEHTPTEVTADGTKVGSIIEGVPIPVGYYYVGGTKNTGVVISDTSADANKGADADLTGNQFVWVPVLQNQKITLDIKTEQEMTGIKITDPLGVEITEDASGNTIDVAGKTSYSCIINPTINGEYKVTVNLASGLGSGVTGSGSGSGLGSGLGSGVTGSGSGSGSGSGLGSGVTGSGSGSGSGSGLGSGVTGSGSGSGSGLGSGVTGSGSGSGSGDAGLGSGVTDTAPEIVATLDVSSLYAQEFFRGESGSNYTDATIATYAGSVNTYGGFYIARYEAGSETAREEGDTLGTAYSKKNMYPYNYVTQTDAITLAQTMDNGSTTVTTDLVNAAAWDRTLNWLIETKAVTETEVISDSTSWGNYYYSRFEYDGKYFYEDYLLWYTGKREKQYR